MPTNDLAAHSPEAAYNDYAPPLLLVTATPAVIAAEAQPSVAYTDELLPLPTLVAPADYADELEGSSSAAFQPSHYAAPAPPI